MRLLSREPCGGSRPGNKRAGQAHGDSSGRHATTSHSRTDVAPRPVGSLPEVLRPTSGDPTLQVCAGKPAVGRSLCHTGIPEKFQQGRGQRAPGLSYFQVSSMLSSASLTTCSGRPHVYSLAECRG